jgi:hypothetical protein
MHNKIYHFKTALSVHGAGGMAQVVECLLSKCEAKFKPQCWKIKKGFFFFFAVMGFELRVHTTSLMFFEIGSCELFAQAGSNLEPPDLCRLIS